MADSTAVNQQLADGITAEVAGLEEFKKLLQAEQSALVAGDVSLLVAISEQKNSHVDKLNGLAAQRIASIQTLGFTADKDGMQKWLRDTGGTPSKLWKSMLSLAAEIQHTNEVNGKLIHTRLQVTQRTLSALLTAVNQVSLYGPSGRPDSTPQSSNVRGIIGKA